MNQLAKTAGIVVIAVVLVVLVWATAPVAPELDRFDDQGEPFYPDFTDPLKAASLEVIDYDEESGTARPFKVQFKDGVWSIPSHYDYPADGEDRLAATAAGVIDLKKDVIQSDRGRDHEVLGVIDPLDETTPTLTGRGQRVTLRDQAGAVLADFIIGHEAEGKQGFRYVRLPDKKRTYAVKVDVDLSTRFADWIETNVLDVSSYNITEVQVDDYTINEQTGRVESAGSIQLARDEANKWRLADLPEGRELDEAKVRSMLSAVSGLTITGVRPKPEALTADLRAKENLNLDLPTRLSLQSKGFFISHDGRLLANEGDVTVGTKNGVRYTLRFGEVLYGEGLAVSAGSENEAETGEFESGESGETGQTENRYLFVTAIFDEALLPPRPVPPAEGAAETESVEEPSEEETADPAMSAYEQELAAWEEQVEEGREKAGKLNDRFAAWYYVISAEDFQNIRLDMEQLTKEAKDPQTQPPAAR
ncbi:MAG: DUF4340 domain-containing protein [Phycisphaerales bacterium]|nr:MAG: DUF4340 domain-containing protein [Phycisphaerales bacterium]